MLILFCYFYDKKKKKITERNAKYNKIEQFTNKNRNFQWTN